jgi:hypothetical protein
MSDFRPIEMFNPTSGPETHMINMDHVSAIFPDSRGKAILLTSMGETIKTHEDYNSMHTDNSTVKVTQGFDLVSETGD